MNLVPTFKTIRFRKIQYLEYILIVFSEFAYEEEIDNHRIKVNVPIKHVRFKQIQYIIIAMIIDIIFNDLEICIDINH